ncbi:IclR family transcriptional regulator [Haloarcula mannanilytica]|uniref:IclR family transcriptional regulator n=2 Tax=Haloarcula mannanilytica TaxID=2509225 RepID=A0A4C2ENP1_9EURY|nr:IclR family transcriptional regulator [Haloarcula mannanilytica]
MVVSMTNSSGKRERKTIQSVETALEILEVIREKEIAGVTEIADEFGRSKSTVHHYLATLEEHGYLERSDGKYQLGLRFLTLGGKVREQEQLYHLGKSDVDKLARETGEKARLIVERDGYGITLYQSSGNAIEDTPTHVGSIEELYCTAAGKAFLAELPDEEVSTYLGEKTMHAYTQNTITDPEELRDQLEAIRSRGIAFDDEERYDGIRCVASSIVSSDDTLLGALSVSAPVDRVSDERFRSEIPDLLQNIVGVVEINTTYSRWEDMF